MNCSMKRRRCMEPDAVHATPPLGGPQVIEDIVASAGRIDVLINNAGVLAKGGLCLRSRMQ
jgi:NAD(P)-dependent dehydrogenase (short-subunit alcohol dehydrogenase family)